MKGLVFHAAGDVRYESMSEPQATESTDVIVKMKLCSICGSDLHIYHGGLAPPRKLFGIGHEAIGEVVEVGRGVKLLKAGDEVMLPGSTGCGKCQYCFIGLVNKCERGGTRVYGIGRELEGCQAEAILVPDGDFNARLIPEGVTPEQALLLTDSLATAHMGCVKGDVGPGKSVAIIGLGPIGLNAVECSMVMGARVVYAIDPIPERRLKAAELGAIAIDPVDALETIKQATAGQMLDCAVEVVGAAATTALALDLVGKEATVSVIGAGLERFDFPIQAAFRKGITFRVSICSVQRQLTDLIKWIQEGRLHPERVISHRMSLSHGAQAYRMFDKREDGVVKIVLSAA
jgi:2-desacetyl-2-hydroxyethyl bacteriochlorophyllide A dehydrogenase